MGRKIIFSLFVLVLAAGFVMVSGPAMAAEEKEGPTQFVGILAYRTGPFAAGGSGFSSGMEDYMELSNMKGGVNGIKYSFEECETAYNTARGVECYNRFKDRLTFVHPLSTGITYALIPKGTADHICIISSGYGRADASDGRVFPWVFTLPTNYWSQNTAKIKFIAIKQGWDGKDMATIGKYLKGLKIPFVQLREWMIGSATFAGTSA